MLDTLPKICGVQVALLDESGYATSLISTSHQIRSIWSTLTIVTSGQ